MANGWINDWRWYTFLCLAEQNTNFCRPAFSVRLTCIDLDMHPPSWIAVFSLVIWLQSSSSNVIGDPYFFSTFVKCESGKNAKEAQGQGSDDTLFWGWRVWRSTETVLAVGLQWSLPVIFTSMLVIIFKNSFICLRVCPGHRGPHCFQVNSHGHFNFSSCRWQSSVASPRMVRMNLWTHWLITGAHLSLWRAG